SGPTAPPAGHSLSPLRWRFGRDPRSSPPWRCGGTEHGRANAARGVVVLGVRARRGRAAPIRPLVFRTREKVTRRRKGYTPEERRVRFLRRRAACTVLARSMAMVMGPTPPGTGVIQPATWRA